MWADKARQVDEFVLKGEVASRKEDIVALDMIIQELTQEKTQESQWWTRMGKQSPTWQLEKWWEHLSSLLNWSPVENPPHKQYMDLAIIDTGPIWHVRGHIVCDETDPKSKSKDQIQQRNSCTSSSARSGRWRRTLKIRAKDTLSRWRTRDI